MAFELPALPYAFDALQPYIDARTMEIHHSKHHQAYITNANNALKDHAELAALSVEALISDLSKVPDTFRTAVRANAGGHYNHSLFWKVLGPDAGGTPSGDLGAAISNAIGRFEAFKEKFSTAVVARFDSGWAWLSVKDKGSLDVYSTSNQDNPLMQNVVDCPGKPILGLDVCERFYYLHYQNRRTNYGKAFWNVVNWEAVAAKLRRRNRLMPASQVND